MSNQSPVRRLAAILALDVVGYSRLMEANEAGTLALLRERRRAVIEPGVGKHSGRIIKVMGDGFLVEFGSAVNAVQCALDLQKMMQEANAAMPERQRLVLRAGVNLGDVIVDDGDIYGDSVNIAARLEQLAEPGGIAISKKVRDEIDRKLPVSLDDLGGQVLKNISTPVHVFRVRGDLDPTTTVAKLPLPDKPSIAVLPFTNVSGEPDQQHFCDGVTDDLITDLSKAAGLFVIASHSSFAFKGKTGDVRSIARELGVRYVLEGSARRSAERIRINAQLIDARDGGHVWADRFDGSLKDIFGVQDEVTAKIVEALVGRLATISPSRNRPASLEAYDLCVRSRFLLAGSPQTSREARALLERAIALDPNYAEAHRWLAFDRWFAWIHWGEPEGPNRSLAVELANKAVALDPNDAGAHWILGIILVFERRWAEAEEAFQSALRLDPSHADAWAMMSNLSVYQGLGSEAVFQVEKAMRLNPHPPNWYLWALGQALYAAGRYEEAANSLKREETYRTGSRRILAASLAQLGRSEDARHEAQMFLVSNPHFRVSQWSDTQPFRDEAARDHFIEGYLKAGLPE